MFRGRFPVIKVTVIKVTVIKVTVIKDFRLFKKFLNLRNKVKGVSP